MDAAVDWLRAKGLAKAAKKSARVAAEGLIGLAVEGAAGALVEVNSETDFVARNARFQSMVAEIADSYRKRDLRVTFEAGDLAPLRFAPMAMRGSFP